MWTKEGLAPPTCPCLPPLRGTPAETRDLHDDLGLKNQNEKEFQEIIYFCFIDFAKPKAFHCVDHNKLWKILKNMEIPEQLTCLLIYLYAGQEAIVRTRHGTTEWFQIGKRLCVKTVYCTLLI